MTRIAVLGAGSWGTALADLLTRLGHDVRIWAHEPDVVADINDHGANSAFLPGLHLAEGLRADGDPHRVVSGTGVIVSATPSHVVRSVIGGVASSLAPGALVISATKGIEESSLARMSEIIEATAPHVRVAVLSGPSFAREVAERQPTAVVAAAGRRDDAEAVQALFSSAEFRVYTNHDVTGVELGGSLKNVIAVAAGMLDGLGLGNNPRAALLTRGLAEITRLGVALGADPATFAGLAGMGDLILTATGGLSRNRALGVAVAQGETLDQWRARNRTVAEGANTSRAAAALAQRAGAEMPIAEQVRAVLFEGRSAADSLKELMGREPKAEQWR